MVFSLGNEAAAESVTECALVPVSAAHQD